MSNTEDTDKQPEKEIAGHVGDGAYFRLTRVRDGSHTMFIITLATPSYHPRNGGCVVGTLYREDAERIARFLQEHLDQGNQTATER